MARIRDPNRDKAYELWKASNGEITNRAIAEQLDIDEKKIAVWKSRDKWNVVQQTDNSKKSVVQQKKKQTKTDKIINKAIERIEDVEEDDFTDKQRLFIAFYLKSWNATKSYQKAYGTDYATASTNGSRLLANAKIREEIQKTRDEVFAESFLSTQAIIQKYMDIAFADITDFIDFTQVTAEATETTVDYNPDGSKKSEKTAAVPYTYTKFAMHHSEDIDGTVITELSKGKDGMFKVKLADRMRALDKLDKYMGLMSEDERLKVEKLRADIDKVKLDIQIRSGDEEEIEDDGFLAALEGKVNEVWDDDEEED